MTRSKEVITCSLFLFAAGTTAAGSVHHVTTVIITVGWCMLLSFALLSGGTRGSLRNPAVMVALLATVLTGLQLLPLPVDLLGIVSPGHDALMSTGWLSPIRWSPITLDIPESIMALLRHLQILAATIVGAAYLSGRRAKDALAGIALTGLFTVFLSLGHLALGLDLPFGRFGDPNIALPAPFINPNHMGAFWALASFAAFGWSSLTAQRIRMLARVTALILGIAAWMSLSRSVIGAYLVTTLAYLFLSFRAGLSSEKQIAPVAIVLLVIGVIFLVAGDDLLREIKTLDQEQTFSKSDIWRGGLDMLADFPLLGVGRGAFGSVYSAYRTPHHVLRYTHLENEWMQTMVDWGGIGAILLFVVVANMLNTLWQASHQEECITALCLLLFAGIQSTHDFSLQLSPIAIVTILPAASALGRARRAPKGHIKPHFSTWLAVFFLIVVPIGCGCMGYRWRLDADLVRIEAYKITSLAKFNRWGETIMRRHPAEYVIPLNLANRMNSCLACARDRMRLLNRSLLLAPRSPDTHRLTGDLLHQMGQRTQAFIEWRMALEEDPSRAETLIKRLLLKKIEARELLNLVDSNTRVAEQLSVLLATYGPALTLALEKRFTGVPTPYLLEIWTRVWYQSNRFDEAKKRADDLIETFPSRPTGYTIAAKIAFTKGKGSEATALLEAALKKASTRRGVIELLANIAVNFKTPEELEILYQKVLFYARTKGERADASSLRAQGFAKNLKVSSALKEFRRATSLAPRICRHWVRSANYRNSIEDTEGAVSTATEGLKYCPESTALRNVIGQGDD
jgi:tetratricopeptide (TPR) repeat protein